MNRILPGWFMTEKQPDKLYPDDVARMLLRLAAHDLRHCTAQKWIVDGGWM